MQNIARFFFTFVAVPALLTACGGRYANAFETGEGLDGLSAASKKAAEGVLSLEKAGSLTYRFTPPLVLAEGRALAIRYEARGGAGLQTGLQAVLKVGDAAWPLPLSAAAVAAGGEDGGGRNFRYVIPLQAGRLERLVLEAAPGEGGREGKAASAAGPAPELALLGLSLGGTWYGFREEPSLIEWSPFVYRDGEGALVIEAPTGDAAALFSGGIAFSAAAHAAADGQYALQVKTTRRVYSARGALHIPAAFLSRASFPLRVSGGGVLREASLYPSAPILFPKPIPCDPGFIIAYPQDAWRDSRFEVFAWEAFPSILIIDFADDTTQDTFLKRLAFFTEKKGYRGRLARDEEIAGLHGWNAHDYNTASLAAFFEKARVENFPLLPEERELEALLLSAGLLRRGEGGGLGPGEGALISITRKIGARAQASVDYLRSYLLPHEAFHGLFFIDEDFRAFTAKRWNALGAAAKKFILSYFDFYGYDQNDTVLMQNEFMAYTMQHGVSEAADYFGKYLPRAFEGTWRASALPAKDPARGNWPVLAAAFAAEARAFSAYAAERWGLAAGRVNRVTVE
ncbi:MAG: hypothetical protein LBR16_03470 [Treponema sp.]|jgi:hypothetical protein|nr:hypothetical protein [Treponema sp.]